VKGDAYPVVDQIFEVHMPLKHGSLESGENRGERISEETLKSEMHSSDLLQGNDGLHLV
jgi:hypothetical protein